MDQVVSSLAASSADSSEGIVVSFGRTSGLDTARRISKAGSATAGGTIACWLDWLSESDELPRSEAKDGDCRRSRVDDFLSKLLVLVELTAL